MSRVDSSESEFAEIQSALNESLEQIEQGKDRPARYVFAELRAKYGRAPQYDVDPSPRAVADLDSVYVEYGKADELEAAILSLESMPGCCTIVPGLSTSSRLIRQLIFNGGTRHTYRLIKRL